jgi:hypothetical protein
MGRYLCPLKFLRLLWLCLAPRRRGGETRWKFVAPSLPVQPRGRMRHELDIATLSPHAPPSCKRDEDRDMLGSVDSTPCFQCVLFRHPLRVQEPEVFKSEFIGFHRLCESYNVRHALPPTPQIFSGRRARVFPILWRAARPNSSEQFNCLKSAPYPKQRVRGVCLRLRGYLVCNTLLCAAPGSEIQAADRSLGIAPCRLPFPSARRGYALGCGPECRYARSMQRTIPPAAA